MLSVPATYDEPKGIFLLEAMANGVPVVQPRRGAFPEVIEATGGGLIVDVDNPESLADGFQALWQDPARAAKLGAAGAAGVREHYSVSKMAEAAESVYRNWRVVQATHRRIKAHVLSARNVRSRIRRREVR